MKTTRNITDFHVHTSISHDGISPAEEYVLLAISGNDEKIAFSEHYDYDRLLDSSGSRIEDLDFYYAEILRLRLKYGDIIQILFGIELGYDPKSCEHYAQIIEKYPFDYVINSTHNINGKDCYLDMHSKTMTKQEAYYVCQPRVIRTPPNRRNLRPFCQNLA